MNTAISTENLSKRYNERLAVDGVDLEVGRGEIFGFLGPNGAGKTTTIMMLLGILPPSAGSVRVLDQPMSMNALALKKRVGVVSEHQALYGDMTTEQYLGFFADMYGVPNANQRIGDLLDALDLASRRKSRVKEFSRGMQQKLAVARALLHSPDLLVMDEPASGLDPYGISQVRELINEQKQQGKTVFLSSHILSEIEQTADRVAIIARGRIVAQGSVPDIRAKLEPGQRYVVEFEGDMPAIKKALSKIHAVRDVRLEKGKLVLHSSTSRDSRPEISRAVAAAGGLLLGITRLEMTLEEAFLTVTDDKVKRLVAAK
ncbi:MAG: ABC transporter ATP-binding protein [Chloroflexia bacterium]